MIALLALALSFASLPQHVALHPSRPLPQGTIAVADLLAPVESRADDASTVVTARFSAAEFGGIPRRLRLHLVLRRANATPAAALALVQFNGALIAARQLTPNATVDTLDVAVPAAYVGTSDALRITVGAPGERLDAAASTLGFDGVDDAPQTVADEFKAAHGRALVAVDPAFAAAAATLVGILAEHAPSVASVDIVPFDRPLPAGYDETFVFAPPDALAARFTLPFRGGSAPFRIVNPLDASAERVSTGVSARAATIQVGRAGAAPLLAFSYVADPRAVDRLAALTADELDVQVADVALATDDGVTAYDVGAKLRVVYADDNTLARAWNALRLPIALALVAAIVLAALVTSRRLARKPEAA